MNGHNVKYAICNLLFEITKKKKTYRKNYYVNVFTINVTAATINIKHTHTYGKIHMKT